MTMAGKGEDALLVKKGERRTVAQWVLHSPFLEAIHQAHHAENALPLAHFPQVARLQAK